MEKLYLLLINTKLKMKTLYSIGLALNKLGGSYKFFLVITTASTIAPFLEALRRYLTPNVDYWAIAVILLILDALGGIYAHSGWWDKDAPNNLCPNTFFFKMLRKVAACALWLVVIGVVENSSDILAEYMDIFSVGSIISWLGWSIAGSIHIFTGGKFPPKKIMDFLKGSNNDKQD